MAVEIDEFVSGASERLFQGHGMARFSFPDFDLTTMELPGLGKEVAWLRRQVVDGCIDREDLVLSRHVAYVDTRPCPQFLEPYPNDENFLGEIISGLRQSGRIPARVENWGETGKGIDLPGVSRFGISVQEIDELIIPAVEQSLAMDGLHVHVPSLGEALYMRFQHKIFPVSSVGYGVQTREWTSTSYRVSKEGEKLGNVFVSGERNDVNSGGVHWWFTKGDMIRMPSLGFRLVVSPKEVRP